MWLCTKLGFYSIVLKTPTEVHIRARFERDLENLRDLCRASWHIIRTPIADYRFRVVIGPEDLAAVMGYLSTSVDYSNFKGVIGATTEQSEKLVAYSNFHHDMEALQNRDLPTDDDVEPDLWELEEDLRRAKKRRAYHQRKLNVDSYERANREVDAIEAALTFRQAHRQRNLHLV